MKRFVGTGEGGWEETRDEPGIISTRTDAAVPGVDPSGSRAAELDESWLDRKID